MRLAQLLLLTGLAAASSPATAVIIDGHIDPTE